MPLGDKVRAARARLGWTTQMLANKAGLSQSYISEIENTGKSPSAKSIMRIAAALGVPGEYLLRDDVTELAALEIETALKNKIDSTKYLPYFVTVDHAIASGVSPEELSEAIQFIAKYKSVRR